MNPRSASRASRAVMALVVFAVVSSLATLLVPTGDVAAVPEGDDAVIAFVASGTGNGHGRGASQWGMYGRALAGHTHEQILDTYYGGTEMGVQSGNIRIRLTAWDGVGRLGVISRVDGARWNGSSNTYASLYAEETSPNRFTVYGLGDELACPGANGVSWVQLDTGVAGPITFSTTGGQTGAAPGNVLGLCHSSGAVTHYRGAVELRSESVGNRVVNRLNVQNYLRSVVPKEVPASWGDDGDGLGLEALQAQAVAARSYAFSQSRYAYARTCDTSSCQVYGGAATRESATAETASPVEHANTDAAIAATSGEVRVWPIGHDRAGDVVSTEFSASNGPRTAGGTFPSVDDPYDDQLGNPLHRWTRIIDADAIINRYGLIDADGVRTENDTTNDGNPGTDYDGIWDNRVRLAEGHTASAWSFRNDFGFPSPGFELIPIRRTMTSAATFAFIGDSIGTGMALGSSSEFQAVTEDVFTTPMYDAVGGRRTQGGAQPDGVAVAETVPVGTDVVVVELGYNDVPTEMPDRIDAVMTALHERSVGLVVWVNLSERRQGVDYAATNAALRDAQSTWRELVVADWESASDHAGGHRWFHDDGVHLAATGEAEFSLWLRDQVLGLVADGYTPPRRLAARTTLRVPVVGVGGVPTEGVSAVALNVTAVQPSQRGHATVWPCGMDVRPGTSSVNYEAGGVSPNAVVVPVDETGEVCVWTLEEIDVLVDVTAWFATPVVDEPPPDDPENPDDPDDPDDGDEPTPAAEETHVGVVSDRLLDTRVSGSRVGAAQMVRVPVVGVGGVPAEGVSAVALNVTAVQPSQRGHATVWPCGMGRPGTSSVNYEEGQVWPNAVVVPVDESGEVCVWTLEETDVLVDVTAWFAFDTGVVSNRLLDTRVSGSRVGAAQMVRVPVVGVGGVPAEGVSAVALNVTAVQPSRRGHATVWPCGMARPGTSSVNYEEGQVWPNAVVVPVDESGEVCVWTLEEADVLVDVTAWFAEGDADVGVVAARLVDTRIGLGPIPPR